MLSHMIAFPSFQRLNNIDSIVAILSLAIHTIAKMWKQLKHPLTDERLMKRQCIHSLGTV